MISSTDLPCENARIADEVPNRTSIPSAPVSIASRASSRWQRTWVSTLARRGSAATVRRSASDCGEAHGEVSSRYSTPNSSSISAIAIFCKGVKWAGANCSPSRSVDSMMLNALMVMAPPKNKKPSSTGTRGLLSWYHPTLPSSRKNGLFESAARCLKTPARSRRPSGSAYCPPSPSPACGGGSGGGGSTCGSEAFFGGALDSPSQLPETLCNPSVRVLALIDAFPYELVGGNDTRHGAPMSSGLAI